MVKGIIERKHSDALPSQRHTQLRPNAAGIRLQGSHDAAWPYVVLGMRGNLAVDGTVCSHSWRERSTPEAGTAGHGGHTPS